MRSLDDAGTVGYTATIWEDSSPDDRAGRLFAYVPQGFVFALRSVQLCPLWRIALRSPSSRYEANFLWVYL